MSFLLLVRCLEIVVEHLSRKVSLSSYAGYYMYSIGRFYYCESVQILIHTGIHNLIWLVPLFVEAHFLRCQFLFNLLSWMYRKYCFSKITNQLVILVSRKHIFLLESIITVIISYQHELKHMLIPPSHQLY